MLNYSEKIGQKAMGLTPPPMRGKDSLATIPYTIIWGII